MCKSRRTKGGLDVANEVGNMGATWALNQAMLSLRARVCAKWCTQKKALATHDRETWQSGSN